MVIKVNMNRGDAAENGKTMRNRRKFLRHIILKGDLGCDLYSKLYVCEVLHVTQVRPEKLEVSVAYPDMNLMRPG